MDSIIRSKLIKLAPEWWLGTTKQYTKTALYSLAKRRYPTDNIDFWRTVRRLYVYGGIIKVGCFVVCNSNINWGNSVTPITYPPDLLEYIIDTLLVLPPCRSFSLLTKDSPILNTRLFKYIQMMFNPSEIYRLEHIWEDDNRVEKLFKFIEVICKHYPRLIRAVVFNSMYMNGFATDFERFIYDAILGTIKHKYNDVLENVEELIEHHDGIIAA